MTLAVRYQYYYATITVSKYSTTKKIHNPNAKNIETIFFDRRIHDYWYRTYD
jgi:hypothetical protein